MPEIGEVARIVHYIREHLVGKTLAAVRAQHDDNVFGKVGTSATEFEKALKGKKIVGAGQQGKYFWMEMDSPPHPLCHFGMAGWFKIKGIETAYYKPTKAVPAEWPPKFWKFALTTLEEPGKPITEAAYVDFRRFGRVRLIDCPAKDLRNTTPLKENGPDPVLDKDIFTVDWLADKCATKRVPIKALLLDQANISGIGNWVGDEVMYDAKIHPEQYSDTLSPAQIKQLHKSIQYVCNLAVETKADSSQFPEHWLFNHRWGKGKKGSANVLPNGAKIVFLKVGGRTSAVIPSVQKKTGKVAGDVKSEDLKDDERGGSSVQKKTGKVTGDVEKEKLEDDEGVGSTGENGEEEAKTDPRRKKPTGRVKREFKTDDVVEDTTNGDAQTVRRKSSKGTARVGRTEIKKEQIPKSGKRKAPIEETEETMMNGLDEVKVETEHADEPESNPQPAKKRKAPKKVESKRASKHTENNTPMEKAQSGRPANEPTPGRRRSARVSGVGP